MLTETGLSVARGPMTREQGRGILVMWSSLRLSVVRHLGYLARFLRVRLRMASGQADEQRFRGWLETHAEEALRSVGVTAGATLLDFGCGAGQFSLVAARLVGPEGRVYALDVKENLLRALSQRADFEGLGQLETVLAEEGAGGVALPEASVDVVLLYDVLQLIEDQLALLRELRRVVKPGGVLSVFPMHVGGERLVELVEAVGGFDLREQEGPLFNFVATGPSSP